MRDATGARERGREIPLATVLAVATPVVSAIVFVALYLAVRHTFCAALPMSKADQLAFVWGPTAVTLAVALGTRQPVGLLVRQVSLCIGVSIAVLLAMGAGVVFLLGGSCGD